jgi:hypothetical protein
VLKNNRNILITVLEVGKARIKVKMLIGLVPGEDLLPSS